MASQPVASAIIRPGGSNEGEDGPGRGCLPVQGLPPPAPVSVIDEAATRPQVIALSRSLPIC